MKDFKLQNHTPRNPYRVPDGYFDSLTQRVMSQLPETGSTAETAAQPCRVALSKPRRRWIGWSVAAAACVGAFLMLTSLPARQESAAQQRQTASVASNATSSTSTYDENYEREVLEYAMVDNNDIYAYMSGDM